MQAAFLALPGCAIWQVADLLRQLVENHWSIRTLTPGGQAVTTDGGLRIMADGDVYRTFPRDLGLLLIAGGTVTDAMKQDPSLVRFLRQYDNAGGVIGSIGEGTALLAASGLLGGLQVATDEGLRDSCEEIWTHSIWLDTDVAADGSIVTARSGAGDSFAHEVIRLVQAYV